MTYEICKEFFGTVSKKLECIGRKCKKHGNDFKYEIIREERKKVTDKFNRERYYTFIIIEVEGTAKINDWEFIATLEVLSAGNVIKRYNNNAEIPERFVTSENICEHCNSKRYRNKLYIIHNTVTNEWKQVGRNCLKLYTKGLNAEYIASYMDGITELEEFDGIFEGSKAYYQVKDIVGVAKEVIDKMGGYYNAQSLTPTKSIILDILNLYPEHLNDINERLKKHKIVFKKGDIYKPETEIEVEKIIEYYKSLKPDSEYIRNVQILLNEEYIHYDNIGLLSYLPEGYYKYINKVREIKEKQATENSDYFYEIGERIKNQKVRDIVVLTCFDNGYNGYNYLCKVVLTDGKSLIWCGTGIRTNMEIVDNSGNHKYVSCIPDKISFTVKDHSEYKGQKQTKITRCKIEYKPIAI